MASRAPIPISEGFEIVEVPPLEIQDAINLLPEHLENRETVAQRLGGHPLALQMHDEDSDLPNLVQTYKNGLEMLFCLN